MLNSRGNTNGLKELHGVINGHFATNKNFQMQVTSGQHC